MIWKPKKGHKPSHLNDFAWFRFTPRRSTPRNRQSGSPIDALLLRHPIPPGKRWHPTRPALTLAPPKLTPTLQRYPQPALLPKPPEPSFPTGDDLWPIAAEEIAQAIRHRSELADWAAYDSPIKDDLIRSLCETFGVNHARPVSSGSLAVELALRASGVGPGDGVVVAAFDYPGNFRAVELLGARPVLADIDPDRASMSATSLDEIAGSDVAKSVKAVVVSHLFGQPADIARISQRCRERGWTLIEDACQAPGMRIGGKPAGCFGDVATLSFGGSKPLTSGGGGAVLTDDDAIAARLRSLADRPSDAFGISTFQAAVLLPQLKKLADATIAREARVAQLLQSLSGRLDRWQRVAAPAESSNDDVGCHYKIAWLVADESTRDHVIRLGQSNGVPLGQAFRSMHRSSPRRCDRPVPLNHSRQFGDRCVLLDHRAIASADFNADRLADRIAGIEKEAEQR
ncbi:UDP-4-amino-4-deoxy-L-arabinose--oxoglutarate aminotransferase [Crateriforma conspicua]|nr:UDP-4-amino-4-deoxy-L-arabinose--oxoglutarate aminotransferase [Crateriforma conspicua]